jgi:hypothetical protein
MAHGLLRNIFALSVLQAANMVSPRDTLSFPQGRMMEYLRRPGMCAGALRPLLQCGAIASAKESEASWQTDWLQQINRRVISQRDRTDASAPRKPFELEELALQQRRSCARAQCG